MTWLQTASSRAFDLMQPDWHQIDFNEIAEVLARLPRFNGHVSAGPYSVAQHSVIGADAIYRDYGDVEAAGCFLLHDGHKAFIGDKITPARQALIETAREIGGDAAAKLVRAAMRELKYRLDRPIYFAAGLGNIGCPIDQRGIVHRYDVAMQATERAHLLGPSPKPWSDEIEQAQPLRLSGRLTAWPWPKAADEFRNRLDKYLPGRLAAASPVRAMQKPMRVCRGS
jgi:hypothetical protein